MRFAVIDVETTGGSANERLTEIAVYVWEDYRIVDEFSTLVNPEKPIPWYVAKLTGITDEMVAGAPRFHEIAKKLVEVTSDAVFVAHNASFDYNVIKREFRNLGYTFRKQTLCTVDLSRKLLPGIPSYSLGNICSSLGIEVQNRHRAGGDAYATVKLFELLHRTDREFIEKRISPELPGYIDQVPETTGVFYFHNAAGDVIYVGRGANMYQRAVQQFRRSLTARTNGFRDEIAGISFEETGSDLIAQLVEYNELRTHRPKYNRKVRNSLYPFGLFTWLNDDGYRCFGVGHELDGLQAVRGFTSPEEGTRFLGDMTDKFLLCEKFSGDNDICVSILCRKACNGVEPPDSYNRRADAALKLAGFRNPGFYLLDTGRTEEEYSVVKVENGKYKGYGFLSIYDGDINSLDGCIRQQPDNRDVQEIIRTWLRKHPRKKHIWPNQNNP